MSLKVGSLFTGAGGLDLAVQQAFGNTETLFVADVCKIHKDGSVGHHDPCRAPCSILAHRYPGVPNLGDVAAIDWTPWRDRIDILCAGFPCQDVSTAGARRGLREGTRTGLWAHVVRAIQETRPRLVLLENVRGLLSAEADSDVEPCPWCLGDTGDQSAMRALGAVLADLADLGFDAEWIGLPASGVGACHQRFRIFILAWARPPVADAGSEHRNERREPTPGQAPIGGAFRELAGRGGTPTLLPTPRASDGTKGGPGQRGSSGDLMLPSAVTLLPTPTTQDGSNNAGPSQFERDTVPLNAVVTLLPTPMANEAEKAGQTTRTDGGQEYLTHAIHALPSPAKWGEFAAAIEHHTRALGRPAPAPTQLSTKGKPQLSGAFTEWMMMWPQGWVTDVPGIRRNEILKACGNGVVTPQAVEAIRWMWRLTPTAVRGLLAVAA